MKRNILFCVSFFIVALFLYDGRVQAQLTDVTQTPNTASRVSPTTSGINKSLSEQVGAGQGDIFTPGSSAFIINRDPFRAIKRGRQIFQRKFTFAQGSGPRRGDGIGNIEVDGKLGAGLADSCAACHGRPRGSAGFGGDVFTHPDSRDAPHLFGLGLVEMLADEITKDLRAIRSSAIEDAQSSGSPVTIRLKSKGIRYGKIKAYPDGSVDTSRVKGINPDLRVRPFFAQGQTISIRECIVGPFNAEMGLEAWDPVLESASAGSDVVTPSGMELTGSIDRIEAPPATEFNDPDGDLVTGEINPALVDHMEFYLLNYFRPATYRQESTTRRGDDDDSSGDDYRKSNGGLRVFKKVGCAKCHIENLVIENDRRVADVDTVYDPDKGVFNNLFATAIPLFSGVDDGSGFPLFKQPLGKQFEVKNIFADFKRHDLGPNFHERNFDGTIQKEFMTEPLWGVGSSAPYGHDGRSINLREVILRHGGEAKRARNRFARLNESQKGKLINFLRSLVLFPPNDTASNLNPGDPNTPGFPQFGHGHLELEVLFNDPTEPE